MAFSTSFATLGTSTVVAESISACLCLNKLSKDSQPLGELLTFILGHGVHEAIALEESQEFKAGIVSQEVHRGFRLGNRLLRPATIKVSTGPGKKKPTAGTEISTWQHPQQLLE
ncbi:hypothetical protein Acr_00g0057260 [Actinidia rufa]|uniref:Uncharacterized protein n=1 Tax=Actinidia rufa TaxID=165716 RepID=A0A7J0DMR1_9ERIC|nr:hypothetical protein Acr_00g0057260 [Actinidia rufa]